MHEVIFHFPCSICWHGKAAGLCPRSSCISSPRKRFLRLSGQILSRTPGRTRGVCGRQGSGPKPFSCTWAPRRRGPCCYLSRVCVCPSRPRIILSAWLPLRGAGAGGGGGGRSHPSLRARALRGATAPPPGPRRHRPPRRRGGAPRWRSGARGCAGSGGGGAGGRGVGGCPSRGGGGSTPVFECHGSGCSGGFSPSFLVFSDFFFFFFW